MPDVWRKEAEETSAVKVGTGVVPRVILVAIAVGLLVWWMAGGAVVGAAVGGLMRRRS